MGTEAEVQLLRPTAEPPGPGAFRSALFYGYRV